MLKCYVEKDGYKKEIINIEFDKMRNRIIGNDLEGNKIVIPADDMIIEEE